MTLNHIFDVHEKAIYLRSQRTEVLASNLANADTPGYKARDIDFKEVLSEMAGNSSAQMVRTNPLHLSDDDGILESSLKYRIPLQEKIDGNTVDPQVENGKFAENSVRYIASLRFMDSKIKHAMIAFRGE